MAKKKKEEPGVAAVAASAPVLVVGTLKDLVGVFDHPVKVDLPVAGKMVRLEGRRLAVAEQAAISELLRRELPPVVGEGENARYNAEDAGYRARMDKCQRQARALAVYWAFPIFRAEHEAGGGVLKDYDAIQEWVESQPAIGLSLMNLLFDAVSEELVGIKPGDAAAERYQNFT